MKTTFYHYTFTSSQFFVYSVHFSINPPPCSRSQRSSSAETRGLLEETSCNSGTSSALMECCSWRCCRWWWWRRCRVCHGHRWGTARRKSVFIWILPLARVFYRYLKKTLMRVRKRSFLHSAWKISLVNGIFSCSKWHQSKPLGWKWLPSCSRNWKGCPPSKR